MYKQFYKTSVQILGYVNPNSQVVVAGYLEFNRTKQLRKAIYNLGLLRSLIVEFASKIDKNFDIPITLQVKKKAKDSKNTKKIN